MAIDTIPRGIQLRTRIKRCHRMKEDGNTSVPSTRSSSQAKSTRTSWAGRQHMIYGSGPVIANDVRVAAYGRDNDKACMGRQRARKAFFAFIHLGTNATEDAFYADLARQPEILKSVLLFIAVLLGDALVTYQLWIIWGQSRRIIKFPILALLGVANHKMGARIDSAQNNGFLSQFSEQTYTAPVKTHNCLLIC
ncbi:hypothetical protein B0H14DRAFT_2591849 [Mycena olivaceomarginata]|nr:hypothetical protein B0H14DRAFT_2591849 [Mycena olivaceomarginata]